MPYKLLPEEPKPITTGKELAETAMRLPAQAISGAASAVPGFVGNLLSLPYSAINKLTTTLGGEDVPYEQSLIGKAIPTTAMHRKALEEGIPYLKPRNKVEKFVKDISQDTAELFLPGKAFKMGKYAVSPIRSMGISLAGNLAGTGTQIFTGDESKADMVKQGTMFGLSLLNPPGAKKIIEDLYSKARSLLPQGASVSTTKLNTQLASLENNILKGRNYNQLADSEKFVIDEINKVRQSTQAGQTDVETITAMKTSLNETLQKKLFELTDRSAKARAREKAKAINGFLRNTLEDYGKTNPQWWKIHSEADKAYGAVQHSNFVSKILERFMKGKSEALSHLFGIGIPAGISFFSPESAIAGGVIYQSAKLADRVWKSPVLRKHYAKVIGAAAAENPIKTKKELDNFENELNKTDNSRYRLLPD